MFEKFVEYKRQQGLAESSITSYRDSWNQFCKWINERHGVEINQAWTATQRDIADFKRYLEKSGGRNDRPAAQSSIRLRLVHLNAIFSFFYKNNFLSDNPAAVIKQPPTPARQPKWLSRNEQNAFVRELRRKANTKHIAIFTLMMQAGLRVHEVVNAFTTDVSISERKGSIFVRGKADKDRTVPLNADVRQALQQYLDERKASFVASGKKKDSPYLFTTQRTDQYTTRGIQAIIEKYRKRLGIEGLTCHALRHTFGHELVTADPPVRLEVVARLMGHFLENGDPNIEMTLIYTTAGKEELGKAVESIAWT